MVEGGCSSITNLTKKSMRSKVSAVAEGGGQGVIRETEVEQCGSSEL